MVNLKKASFQEKLKSAYIAREYEDLGYVYSLERAGLKEAVQQAKENPESAIKNLAHLKHMSKSKKIITQIFQDPQPVTKQTISINQVRLFWAQVFSDDTDKPEAVEEAQIISTKKTHGK